MPALTPQWIEIPSPSSYQDAVLKMESHARAVIAGTMDEAIFLTEHRPVYTAGTSAQDSELLNSSRFETVRTGRGGQWTYHGPGQLVIWPVLNLNQRNRDVRAYIHSLEGWVIDVLDCFGIDGIRRDNLPGIWVRRTDINMPDKIDKIGAVGVRLSRWVTMHGLALNIDPDLSHFDGIVPCGVRDGGVTSLYDLGQIIRYEEVMMALQDNFSKWFGPNSQMAIKA